MLGGWRKGEIVNLRHEDVDLAAGWAYVLDFEDARPGRRATGRAERDDLRRRRPLWGGRLSAPEVVPPASRAMR
jgi:hypothetical protein